MSMVEKRLERLCPQPNNMHLYDKTLQQNDRIRIQVESRELLIGLQEILQDIFGGRLKNKVFLSLNSGTSFFRVIKAPKMKTEAYQLVIGEREINLRFGTAQGQFYGLITLFQIMDLFPDNLPCMKISDAPLVQNRGIMLDVSRCKVPKVTEIKTLIKRMAFLKLNQFQLYMEHSFAYENHTKVWEEASPYTAADILEIDRYCKRFFIQLIPNQNSFGHFERWLKHKEYIHLAESPSGSYFPGTKEKRSPSTLKPDEQSLKLIRELYDELLPCFKSNIVNVGGDETWELGQGASKQKCDHIGKEKVYTEFLLKLQNEVLRREHRMMFWADIIVRDPSCIKSLDKSTIGLCWGYTPDHPFDKECAAFAKVGLTYYVCPGTSTWRSFIGRTNAMKQNLLNASGNAVQNRAAGYLLTDWGDLGHHQYHVFSWPGFILGASLAWHHKKNQDLNVKNCASHWILGDESGKFGDLLWQAGELVEIANCNMANSNFWTDCAYMTKKQFRKSDFYEKLEPKNIQKIIKELDLLIKKAQSLTVSGIDALTFKEEFLAGLQMTKWANYKILSFYDYNTAKKTARVMLRNVKREHQRLWLIRNREGGLNESLKKLK
ncbi:MAG: family 20 glycosylhydrolase [Lentisphaeria bacterium]|nr:family 20 glycosylhydrolase [Lentisphaeria bacterium]